MTRPSETDEWLEELVEQWTEVYKKSVTTLLLLQIIRSNPQASVSVIGPAFHQASGWSLTERGLYRTLHRLADNRLLTGAEVAVARTGKKRKEFTLTDLGSAFLHRIEQSQLTTGTQTNNT